MSCNPVQKLKIKLRENQWTEHLPGFVTVEQIISLSWLRNGSSSGDYWFRGNKLSFEANLLVLKLLLAVFFS